MTTLGLVAFTILTCAAACSSEPLASSDADAGSAGKSGGGSAGKANGGGNAGKATGGAAGKTSGGSAGGLIRDDFGPGGYGGCQNDCCDLDCDLPTCDPGFTMTGDFCEDYEEGEICADANQDPCNFGQSFVCSNGEWNGQEAFPAPCGGAGGQGGNGGDSGQGGARL